MENDYELTHRICKCYIVTAPKGEAWDPNMLIPEAKPLFNSILRIYEASAVSSK